MSINLIVFTIGYVLRLLWGTVIGKWMHEESIYVFMLLNLYLLILFDLLPLAMIISFHFYNFRRRRQMS